MLARYIAVNTAVVFFSFIMISAISLWPNPEGKVAVIYWPWVEKMNVFQNVWSAGGVVLSVEGSVAVAVSDTDDFFTKLRHHGAILIVDADKLAALCGGDLR